MTTVDAFATGWVSLVIIGTVAYRLYYKENWWD